MDPARKARTVHGFHLRSGGSRDRGLTREVAAAAARDRCQRQRDRSGL